jgi:hypothetical protein
MKMLMIICSEERQADVRALIDRHDVHAFSEIRDVLGAGRKGKHLGTHTWPGTSALIFTVVSEEKFRELVDALKKFRSELFEGEGIRVFSLPVESEI